MISYGNEQVTGLSLLLGNNANKMRNSLSGSLSTSNTSSLSTFSYDHGILETRPIMSIPGIYIEETTDDILDKLEQAGRVPSKEKFRRMACNTFIYTGACPYNDRCVFLHDYRIKTEGAKVRTTRQTKINSAIKDTFYWPDMVRKDVSKHLDAQGLPTANQMYVIPESFKHNPHNFHNRGLYSMWTHFVEFCIYNNVLVSKKGWDLSQERFFDMSNYRDNPHVPHAKRLAVFIHLSMTPDSSSKQKPSLTDIVANEQEAATSKQTSQFFLPREESRGREAKNQTPFSQTPLPLISNTSSSRLHDEPSRNIRSDFVGRQHSALNGSPGIPDVEKPNSVLHGGAPSMSSNLRHPFVKFTLKDELDFVDESDTYNESRSTQSDFDKEGYYIPSLHPKEDEDKLQLGPIETDENEFEEDYENDTGTQMWMSMKRDLSGTFSMWSPLPPSVSSKNCQNAFDELDNLVEYDIGIHRPRMNTLSALRSDFTH